MKNCKDQFKTIHKYLLDRKYFQIIELEEKVRMLESQNLKLIEKNQSDVVEWRSKERDFNVHLNHFLESNPSTLT